jgi:hypothetical protein
MTIVVAPHEVHIQRWVACAPFGQACERSRFMRPRAVQQIAQKYEFGSARGAQQIVKALNHRRFSCHRYR